MIVYIKCATKRHINFINIQNMNILQPFLLEEYNCKMVLIPLAMVNNLDC